MKISYSKNYILIYFWQLISVFLGLASLFIVMPFLSIDKTVFGIYSVCISLTVFYSYADIGFLSAGQKYASESYAKNDFESEIKITSFTGFVFLIFVIFISFFLFLLSINPNIIISKINSNNELIIAKQLLIILACSSPIIVGQRILQLIYSIRVQDFIFQRFSVIGNVIKVCSIYFFFNEYHYYIVYYFLFTQIVNLGIVLSSYLYLRFKVKYNFQLFIKNFKFTITTYSKVSRLAYTSLFLTISWVIYYELDLYVIGKFLGPEMVSIFAVGLSLLSLFRSFFGIFYSPFTTRFNHFIGAKDIEGLKFFFLHIIKLFLPLVVIPILVVSILAKPFVLSWVGINYVDSILIAKILVLCNIMGFISYPAGSLFVALEKVKVLYYNALFIPILYWGGIILTYDYWGLKSFAIFKVLSFLISGFVYFFFSLRFMNVSLSGFINDVVFPQIISISSSVILAFLVSDFLPTEHSKSSLIIVILTVCGLVITGWIISIISSIYLRNYLITLYRKYTFKDV